MATKEIQDELSSIEKLRDVVNLSADTLLGGTFTDVARDEFWDGKGQEFHIKQGNRIVCRIIEIPEDGLSFREVKTKLKRQGKKGGELFSIVVTSQSDDGDLLEKKLTGSIKFVRVESRISSDSVDVKHDLRYFEVDPDVIEPLYIDYLNELQINGRSLSEMEEDVTEIFSIKRITKNFYRDFSDIFHDKLKPAINGLENEEENLTSYAQLVVNRILFLMFVQEKGWLNENKTYIQDRYSEIREDNERDAYNDFFKPLFFEALNDTQDSPDHLGRIPYLNGGLFEERTEEEDVEIDEEFFEALLSPEEDIHDEKEGFLLRYKLSLSENNPAEQELVVDPEFIGRIFEMFMVSEERSEKGAFYTPKEITQYMSKNAIKQLLLNELPEKEDEISQLVLNHTTEGLEEAELETIQKELRDINVLDPAVGSGAFVIAVMEELVEINEAINDELGRDENRFEMKEHMIARNLYGVDIDESGIELCKFRTWLHLIQDLHISLDELIEDNDRYALPNLDFKFFVGNSLTGDYEPTKVLENFKTGGDYQTTLKAEHNEEESIIEKIEDKRIEYTDAHGGEKAAIESEIGSLTDQLEESIDWSKSEYYMNEVVSTANSDFKWSVKVPEVMIEGGFDIVIGNPPYKGGSVPDYIEDLSSFYSENDLRYEKPVRKMVYDLYQKFVYRGEELTKNEGVFTYITSSTFLSIATKTATRNLLQSNRLTDLVIANPDTFDAAVEPAIFTTLKGDYSSSNYSVNYIDGYKTETENYRRIIGYNSRENLSEVTEIEKASIEAYKVPIKLYRNSIRSNFFKPTKKNLEIYNRFVEKVTGLYDEWKNELFDVDSQRENLDRIEESHINDLEVGDVTIQGLVTWGGEGLKTGSNEDHLAFIDGSPPAEELKERNENFKYIQKNEKRYRYLSRVIKEENVVKAENLTEEEKRNGIEGSPSWVKYQKGAKKDDIYYKKSYVYIDWSKESLEQIREHKAGRIRDTSYYFRESLFASRGGTGESKIRYVNNSVIDSSGMVLIPTTDLLPAKYLLGVLNSKIGKYIIRNFINGTVNTQVADMRLLPIVVPSEDEQEQMIDRVNQAIQMKREDREADTDEIQRKIDNLAEKIYGVDLDGE